jgi:hypothetical protein
MIEEWAACSSIDGARGGEGRVGSKVWTRSYGQQDDAHRLATLNSLSPQPSPSPHPQTATSAALDTIDDPLAGRAGPKLFVGSLAKSVQEKDVLNLFLPYGKIVDIAFFWHMHGPRKGEPKGYCFLTYARTEDATAAIKALDDVRVHGRAIAVRYQKDADEGGNDTRSMMVKARAKSMQQQSGGSGGSGGKDKGGAGSGAAAGVASVALPKRPKSACAAAPEGGGGGGGSGREGREQESVLEAKIRMLKAQIAAGSGGGGVGSSSRRGGSSSGGGGGRRG